MQPIQDHRLAEIRQKTVEDFNMRALAEVIAKGWPNNKESLPNSIKLFFDYRDELTIQDGLILRGQRIVILHAMQSEMKQKAHAGYLGRNTCLRRARDLIFWSGMSKEIRQYIEGCGTCATYVDRQPAEAQIISPVSERPWQQVAADLLSWGGNNYLITVDKT